MQTYSITEVHLQNISNLYNKIIRNNISLDGTKHMMRATEKFSIPKIVICIKLYENSWIKLNGNGIFTIYYVIF